MSLADVDRGAWTTRFVRQLPVVVRHGEIEGIDAAEIAGIDDALAGDDDDIILGISRTSKTPTSIYLAQRRSALLARHQSGECLLIPLCC